MLEFIGVCLALASAALFFMALIALVRPMPRLRMGTRRKALYGLGGSFLLFAITGIFLPTPPAETSGKKAVASSSVSNTPKQAPSVAEKGLTAEQDSAVSFARALMIQTVACSSSVDTAQSTVDKAAAERARPIDAYMDAKSAAKFCRDATADIKAISTEVPDGQRKIAAQAIKYCGEAATVRADAMKRLMAIIDGAPSLEDAAQYKEKKNEAAGHDYACRMTLQGLGQAMKIPDGELEFAKTS